MWQPTIQAAASGGVITGASTRTVVVRSGERVDVRWTVPNVLSANPGPTDWIVGCHIPGHLANGMWIPIRWVVDPAS